MLYADGVGAQVLLKMIADELEKYSIQAPSVLSDSPIAIQADAVPNRTSGDDFNDPFPVRALEP
jgi:hypothetical protein